jgi:glycosyltransferase involved in cell wall biosynthesis
MQRRVKQSLTVVQLLPALDGGGAERGTLEVAAALVRRGHRSLVISDTGRYVSRLEAAGSRHIGWPVGRKSPLTLRWIGRLRRLLLQEQADILHARSRMPAWVAWLAWRSMPPEQRPRFVTTVHGLYSVSAYSAVMTRGERVIAVSDYARDYIHSAYPGVDPARIEVIHRGVDPARYPAHYHPQQDWLERWYRQYPETRGRYVITLPGRLTRRKGVLDFIDIIRRLDSGGIPVQGLLVGEFPAGRGAGFREECEARIAAAGLKRSIALTGYRDDLREILSISAVVLSLSRHPEAFGRTVNEALSLGRPVAGYAHGGVGEQLAELFPAGRVSLGDRQGMAERLALWHQQPPQMEAVKPYRLDNMLQGTLQLYETLAGERNSRVNPVV